MAPLGIGIGIGSSFFSPPSGGGGLDPDAEAFLTAAGITDATITLAIDTLVKDLKNYGIWTKAYVIYPFVGGTASSHKYNLKDPRDLDGAFRAVFSGGVTHNSAGVTGNAINGWYDTKFGTSILNLAAGAGIFLFSGNEIDTGVDLSNFAGAPNNAIQMSIRAGNTFYSRCNSIPSDTTVNTTSTGFYGVNREPGDSSGYFNTLRTTEIFKSQTYTATSATIYGFVNGPFGGAYGARNHQTAVIASGLNATERANLRTALTAFNVTNLSR